MNTQRSFVAGPGEGLPFRGVSLNFEGVVRVEGNVLRLTILRILDSCIQVDLKICSVSPRRHHVLFSTQDPPTIQSMPWPIGNDEDEAEVAARTQFSYETWLLNDQDFEWLVETDGKRPGAFIDRM